MKYIDAERLKAEVERIKNDDNPNSFVSGLVYLGKKETIDEFCSLIDSLQQEQPSLPGIEENGIPGKDFIPVEWVDACEKYGKWKIVKVEQPEVFDTVAFQKGVKEGRRLEREDALSIADIEKLHTFLYAVKNNKQGAFTFTRLSDEQYEEVLRRFNNAKEK